MRLIDADALKERLAYRFFDITAIPATAVVDAAPTVCCARCRWFNLDTEYDAAICGDFSSSVLMPTDDFGCPHFMEKRVGD